MATSLRNLGLMNMAAEEQDLLERMIDLVVAHECRMKKSFSLIPSENTLSPLARLLMLSDIYARYFFDDDRLWGTWAFPGGKQIGAIQEEILYPVMRRLAKARYINVKPVSGLNGMTVALSTYCKQGDHVMIVPGSLGGHASTAHVARALGLRISFLPAEDAFDVDDQALRYMLKHKETSLIYIDQANVLFPLNIAIIRQIVSQTGTPTKIHVDTSHTNGLIFGGVLKNPLECGADSFGGSLHKSFPGPHKAFFATNENSLYQSYLKTVTHLVSHHHAADMLALTASALEFEQCDGKEYARRTVENAQHFARMLHEAGFIVAAAERGFTATHQIWLANANGLTPESQNRLNDAGFLVNAFGQLPAFQNGGMRLGLNEITRFGVQTEDMSEFAELFIEAATGNRYLPSIHAKVAAMRQKFSRPLFCLAGYEQALNVALTQATTFHPLISN